MFNDRRAKKGNYEMNKRADMNNEILVSVYCLAYNHEKYIRDCLDGFINQKTNFKFEVIVHDDASTDGTADIIKEYAEKYPDIIKPIFQNENQYSKGIAILLTYIIPKCHGKYIAICEGDDYWCDDTKLQKQADILEAYPDYVACVHANKVINYLDDTEWINSLYNTSRIVNVVDVLTPMIPVFHTTSIFYRKSILDNRPDFFTETWDYALLVYLAILGPIYYINENMSVYRTLLPGSWTMRNHGKNNRKKELGFQKYHVNFLKAVDEYSDFKYHDIIDKNILNFEYQVWRVEPYFKLLFNKRLYKLGFWRSLKMIFRCLIAF